MYVISLFGEELATNMNSCSNYVGNVSEKNGTIKPKWPKAHNERKFEAHYKCLQISTLLKNYLS